MNITIFVILTILVLAFILVYYDNKDKSKVKTNKDFAYAVYEKISKMIRPISIYIFLFFLSLLLTFSIF